MDKDGSDADRAYGGTPERRIALLIGQLPEWMRPAIHRLRQPAARWVRIPVGVLLILGGFLSLLPVFGLWMLPLGLLLLADDLPPMRRVRDRLLCWIEMRHPRWMGLATPPSRD
ncbi:MULTISPECIES: hypothetical protein [Nguyenibacter]|uniref:Transmembrane protein (PGPGW) n=1 Tax=Nguyenibacter vanlangensis TaxID=1216886 RepID=A0A7Y7IVL0_9PROT|nr:MULTISPECIES: hypothetical protein [Nguyenibacter]NVN10888.1 hypothetical protein [Nguyenibacter vanlangensis]WRH88211.1 hypothetical protein QN315_00750 [Nguyenibacter sp. L1]